VKKNPIIAIIDNAWLKTAFATRAIFSPCIMVTTTANDIPMLRTSF
jgi:soluble P-type ATPase